MNPFVRFVIFLTAAAAISVPATAAFTVGDLYVLTVPSTSGNNAGLVTINDYSFNGSAFSLVGTHAIDGITLPGTNDHDGLLHFSTDNSVLTFAGFNSAVGAPIVNDTATVWDPTATRLIGAVNSNFNVTTTALTGYTGVSVRSVVSTDGKHFWTAGNANTTPNDGGQYYVDASGSSVTQTQIATGDARGNTINHGQLWSISSSTGGASTVGTGLPTGAASLSTLLPGGNAKSDVVFLDLNNDGTSDTAYTTDGKNILAKWNFNGTAWSQTGNVFSGDKTFINNINSLQAFVYNGTVQLVAATNAGQLFDFTDSTTLGAGFGSAFTNTQPTPALTQTGAIFRGMAIAVPEPAALAVLGMVLRLLTRRRHST